MPLRDSRVLGEGAADPRELLQHLLGSLPGTFALIDEQGRLVRWNERLERITGYATDELRDASCFMLVDEDERDAVGEKLRGILAHGAGEVEATIVTKDGRRIPVFFNGNRVEVDGRAYIAGVSIDISERVRAEEALRASESRYRAVVEDQSEFIVRCLPDGTRTFVNDAYCRYFGRSSEDLIGETFFAQIPEAHRAAVREKIDALTPENPVALDEHLTMLADGTTRWQEWVDRGVFDAQGRLVEVQAVGRDTSQLRELSDRLDHQSRHDGLTGLVNREECERRLGQLVARAREAHAEHVVCYVDVDQLHLVNSAGGHVAGDALIRHIACILTGLARRDDTTARVAGDEFAVLMGDCTLSQAWRLVRDLRQRVGSAEFVWESTPFTPSLSIGLIGVDETSRSPDEVLRLAADACTLAKESGSGVHVASADDTELIRLSAEAQWVSRIERALRDGRIRLEAQRIAPVSPSRAEGDHFELLVRMIDEDGASVPPGRFLPIAERYRLSPRVDQWVVDAALSRMADHASALEGIDVLSINLSGSSLGDDTLMSHVPRRLAATGVPAEKVCFEVTETAAVANLGRALGFIEAMRGRGCRFSLDDFGAGLSSFAYLKNLPVDYLKIDGMFVKSIAENAVDRAMVRSINDIGHTMGKRTIAEFVENDAILGHLREIGVDYAQGYGIARPEPFESVLR